MTAIKRMNSFEWRKELNKDIPIELSVILPNGSTVSEKLSKFDMIIPTLCAKYGLESKDYRIKDVNNPTVKFSNASTLADFEDNPYTMEELYDLTLKLKKRTIMNRLIGKGLTKKRKVYRRKTRNRKTHTNRT